MTSPDQYAAEVAVGRAALGSPREAAAAWRSGCFVDRMISEVGPAMLAACVVWDDRKHRWEEADELVRLAAKSLNVAGAWAEDLRIIGEGEWLSPYWGIGHLCRGVSAMLDPESSSKCWRSALASWRVSAGLEAA